MNNSYSDNSGSGGIYVEYASIVSIFNANLSSFRGNIYVAYSTYAYLSHVEARNSYYNVFFSNNWKVTLMNCNLYDSIGYSIYSVYNTNVTIANTVVDGGSNGLLVWSSTSFNRYCYVVNSMIENFENEGIVTGYLTLFYLDGSTIANCKQNGITPWYSSSNVFRNSLFMNNYSPDIGGAIYEASYGNFWYNLTFRNNSAATQGGAVFLESFSVYTIEKCTFENNMAAVGGALMWWDRNSNLFSTSLTFIDCIFKNNFATNAGGAVYIFYGVYNMIDVECSGNIARSMGGCLCDLNGATSCDLHSDSYIEGNSVFSNNQAYMGGAIYTTNCALHIEGIGDNEMNDTDDSGLSVSTIWDLYDLNDSNYVYFLNNSAVMFGGGIMMDLSTANATVKNVRFVSNRAQTVLSLVFFLALLFVLFFQHVFVLHLFVTARRSTHDYRRTSQCRQLRVHSKQSDYRQWWRIIAPACC